MRMILAAYSSPTFHDVVSHACAGQIRNPWTRGNICNRTSQHKAPSIIRRILVWSLNRTCIEGIVRSTLPASLINAYPQLRLHSATTCYPHDQEGPEGAGKRGQYCATSSHIFALDKIPGASWCCPFPLASLTVSSRCLSASEGRRRYHKLSIVNTQAREAQLGN